MAGQQGSVIDLRAEMFAAEERRLVRCAAGTVSTFRYASGVEAIRVVTDRVEMVVLPFRGQQVWRLAIDGEDVTMTSTFDEPTSSLVFEESYGAFLLHCGGSAVGHPGPEDSHPLHGELPLAGYDTAQVIVHDGDDPWVGVTGTCRVRRTHTVDLEFAPVVTVRPGAASIDIDATLTNRRSRPFEYAYLCHVNFALFDGSTLEQSSRLDAQHFTLFPDVNQDAETAAHLKRIAADPAASGRLDISQPLVPEYCALILPEKDEAGWAHFLQIRPRGDAAFVSFDTSSLPLAVRWISNTGDEVAAGFCLPSTTHHLGRAAAQRDGLLRSLAAGESVGMHVIVGMADENEAADMTSKARRLAGGPVGAAR